MHAWKKSACVVLAWSVLSIILMTAGMNRSVHPAQANTRTTRSTEVILTSTSTLSVAAAPMTAASSPASYVVQPGDSLAGIAARFAVRGGWPALYAANQRRIGPDPDAIRPGTVLVLPGVRALARYTVAAGDTLAGIAAALSVRGGWPALYAANQRRIGPDPDAIRPGTVLAVPQRAPPAPPAPGPVYRPHLAPPPSPPAGTGHQPPPVTKAAPAARGMPSWLKTLLLAVGPLILVAFLAVAALAVRRRWQQAAGRAVQPGKAGVGRRRDRSGRSRSVAGSIRPVAAAARVHPAGIAVPSAVLVTGIVLFTFVTTMRVAPPLGRSGPGSVRADRPGTGQPHHRLQPRQPRQPALPSSPGQNARCLTGSLEQIASPLPVPAAVPPAGPGRAPQAPRNPSSRLPGGGLVCDVKQVPRPAATAAAGSGGADR